MARDQFCAVKNYIARTCSSSSSNRRDCSVCSTARGRWARRWWGRQGAVAVVVVVVVEQVCLL